MQSLSSTIHPEAIVFVLVLMRMAVLASGVGHRVAFIANSHKRAIHSTSRRRRCSFSAAPYACTQSPLHQSRLDSDHDVFLVSIDGTLASSSRSRSYMALCVALKVWPALKTNMEAVGINPNDFDWDVDYSSKQDESSYEWLLQKLSALSSVTQQGNNPDAMLGCDSVLLARLLLEEQLLDGGRSNGRGGKYGSKFHPSSTADESRERSNVGSRPLTVGEIYANWHELRDVTRMKYPFVEEGTDGKVKRQDPLPIIRQHMKEYYSAAYQLNENESNDMLPTWQSIAYDVLFDYSSISPSQDSDNNVINLRQNTMLLLGHEAQVPLVLKSLSSFGCSIDIESDLDSHLHRQHDAMKPTPSIKKSSRGDGISPTNVIVYNNI